MVVAPISASVIAAAAANIASSVDSTTPPCIITKLFSQTHQAAAAAGADLGIHYFPLLMPSSASLELTLRSSVASCLHCLSHAPIAGTCPMHWINFWRTACGRRCIGERLKYLRLYLTLVDPEHSQPFGMRQLAAAC